jgi:hypothetical protein
MGLNWIYQDKEFTENDIGEYYGFVYIITNNINKRMYVGKKFFYSLRSKIVKGKKKRMKLPSDWQKYYGSNEVLKKDVIDFGKENFTREIIHLCISKGECGYLEAKEQFIRGVMESDNYYNVWIMVRVRKSHIKDYNDRISQRDTEGEL